MLKEILIISLTIFSLNCFSQVNPQIQEILGTWKLSKPFGESKLILNSDNTYQYLVDQEMLSLKSTGTWKIKKNKLILNSFKQIPTETTISSSYRDTINGTLFIVKDIEGQPIPMPEFKIRDNLRSIDTLITNMNGIFYFNNIKNVLEFNLSFLGFKKARWIEEKNNNFFEIVLAPEMDYYLYQKNEVWIIRGDRLYSPFSKKEVKALNTKNKIDFFQKE